MIVSRIFEPCSKSATCMGLDKEGPVSSFGKVLGLGSVNVVVVADGSMISEAFLSKAIRHESNCQEYCTRTTTLPDTLVRPPAVETSQPPMDL